MLSGHSCRIRCEFDRNAPLRELTGVLISCHPRGKVGFPGFSDVVFPRFGRVVRILLHVQRMFGEFGARIAVLRADAERASPRLAVFPLAVVHLQRSPHHFRGYHRLHRNARRDGRENRGNGDSRQK